MDNALSHSNLATGGNNYIKWQQGENNSERYVQCKLE